MNIHVHVHAAQEKNSLGISENDFSAQILARTSYLELAKMASFFANDLYNLTFSSEQDKDKVNNQGSLQNYLEGERKASKQ